MPWQWDSDACAFPQTQSSTGYRLRLEAILITKSPSPNGGLAKHSVVPSLMGRPSWQWDSDACAFPHKMMTPSLWKGKVSVPASVMAAGTPESLYWRFLMSEVPLYRGTSLIRNCPPPSATVGP